MVLRKKIIPVLPTTNGICLSCGERNDCSMVEFLQAHYTTAELYGTYDYRYKDPAAWDEFSIDDPIIEDGEVTWCPEFSIKGTNNDN